METEIWKDIVGYEGLYQVSNLGRVKSLERKVKNKNGYRTVSDKILKQAKKTEGYLFVNLWKEGKQKIMKSHRLVAEAFLPNPENLPQVNHKDENPSNNNVSNLEFCTAKYNVNFGTRNKRAGISISKALTGVYNNIKKSKPVMCIETGIIYPSSMEVQRQFGFANGSISQCCNGKRQTCCGYHWKWAI